MMLMYFGEVSNQNMRLAQQAQLAVVSHTPIFNPTCVLIYYLVVWNLPSPT
jgi:hypothetical protein